MHTNSPDVQFEDKNTNYNPGALGPRAARNPPDPHYLPSYPLMRKIHGSFSQCVSFSFIDVGSILAALVSHEIPLPYSSKVQPSATAVVEEDHCSSEPIEGTLRTGLPESFGHSESVVLPRQSCLDSVHATGFFLAIKHGCHREILVPYTCPAYNDVPKDFCIRNSKHKREDTAIRIEASKAKITPVSITPPH
eukprot:1145971-Pelagomonas_calceolata.AAC.2